MVTAHVTAWLPVRQPEGRWMGHVVTGVAQSSATVCVAEQRTEPELKLIPNADQSACGSTLQQPKTVSNAVCGYAAV